LFDLASSTDNELIEYSFGAFVPQNFKILLKIYLREAKTKNLLYYIYIIFILDKKKEKEKEKKKRDYNKQPNNKPPNNPIRALAAISF
jgi:hypothetical protein